MTLVGKMAKVVNLNPLVDNSVHSSYVSLVGQVIQYFEGEFKLRFDDGKELWFLEEEVEFQ